MTALWIIIGIVAAICLLLATPVKAQVVLHDKISATVRYLFIKFKFHNLNPMIDDEPETAKGEEPDKLDYIKSLIDKKGFSGAVYELCDIFKLIIKKVKLILPHIIVKNFNLKIRVGSADAAISALEYGAVCAIAYPTIGLAESLVKFKKQKVDISCDYNNENSVLEMNAILKIRLIFLIRAFSSFVLSYIKNTIGNNNKKDGATNE